MAQYDGSIRINTEIDSKKASAQLMSLENRIVKTADRIAALRSKMDALKDVKTPTKEYEEISEQIKKAESEFDKLLEKQEKMQQEGKDNGAAWDNLNEKMEEVGSTISFAQSELQDLVDTGKAFTLGSDTENYKKLSQQLKYLENDYKVLIQRKAEFEEKHDVKSPIDGYERLKNALEDVKSVASKITFPVQRLKDAFTFHDVDKSGYDRLENALNDLKDTAKQASDSVKKSFTELKENPISASAGAALDIGNKMNAAAISAMGNMVDVLGNGISKSITLFWRMRDSIGKAVDSAVLTVREKMAGLAGSMINTLLHPIQTIKNVAKTSMGGISNILKSSFSSAMDGLKEKAAGAAASIINGIIHPIQTLKNIIPAAINTTSGLFRKMQSSIKGITGLLSKVVSTFKKIGGSIAWTFKKATSTIGALSRKIKELAQKHMPRLRKETDKTQSSFSTFGRRIKELLLSALIFNRISAALNSMVTGTKEGLNNLVMYSDRVNDSMSMLMSSMTRLKNSFATAFAPLLNVVAPILSRFIDLISEAATKVGMFFAALTGQTTFEKAIKVQQDYRESLEGTAEAEKEAAKEQDKYLSGLDEIRRWESNKDEDEEDELKPEDMFTTVPVENSMVELADKVKDVFKKLFAPLKEAWKREGKFVMDSWKYALKEVWKLAKDIGRDFLKVWNQEATIAMLADMLHIIGDIGLIVGNLAGKFREAWNYNNTGLHILENIRDIFAVIIHNIREAADYTVEWTKTLDFRPLLTSIENVTSSLIRFADFVSGTLVDFYTEFILPLASWSLSEQGLPRLFNILASFMDSINWEGLRTSLKSLYQALEPYAEEIGNGLIDFIEKMKDEGVEFFNFLPGAIQRAADALRAGDLPAAFMEFGSISGEAVKMAFNNIRHAIESINWGEIGTLIASFINGIDWMGVGQSIFGALSSAVNGAIDLIYNFITTTDWRAIGTAFGANLQNAWNAIDWQQAGETVGAGLKSIFDFLLAIVQQLDWAQIGRDIGMFLSAIPWNEILGNVFEILGIVFGGLLNGLKESVPGKILTTIGEILASLKLTSFLSSAATTLFTAIFGVPAGTVLGLLFSAIAALASVLVPVFVNFGEDLINGLFNGIIGVIKGIGQWIYDHVFKPFIDGFKTAFGIHSPSTVMQEQGGFIIEGLRKGIADKWTGFVQFWTEKKNELVDKFNDVKEKFLTKGRNIVDGIKGGISEKWGDFTTYWGNKKESVISKFNDIREKISPKGRDIIQGIRNGIDGEWGVFDIFLGRKKDDIPGKFSNIKNDMEGIGKKIVNGIVDGIQSIWSSLTGIAGRIADMFNINIKTPSVSAGASSSRRSARSVSGLPYNTIAPLVNAPIPYLATGAVIPPNKEFMAVLGDQKHGNNIEAPESLLRKIIREEMRGNQSGGGNYRFSANINRRVLFDEIIEEGKLRQTVTGRNAFELA